MPFLTQRSPVQRIVCRQVGLPGRRLAEQAIQLRVRRCDGLLLRAPGIVAPVVRRRPQVVEPAQVSHRLRMGAGQRHLRVGGARLHMSAECPPHLVHLYPWATASPLHRGATRAGSHRCRRWRAAESQGARCRRCWRGAESQRGAAAAEGQHCRSGGSGAAAGGEQTRNGGAAAAEGSTVVVGCGGAGAGVQQRRYRRAAAAVAAGGQQSLCRRAAEANLHRAAART